MIVELVTAIVLSVIDGDTIKARAEIWPGQTIVTSVRLDGVDTPELRGKCEGEKALARTAKARAAELMPVGKPVTLHHVRRGKYAGRVVARVTVGGKDVAAILIAEGLGRPYHGERRRGWCGATSLPGARPAKP